MNLKSPSMLSRPLVQLQMQPQPQIQLQSKKLTELGSVARVEVSARNFNWRKPFEKGESYQASGSASFIQLPFTGYENEYYLLTAFHVVENAERIWSAFVNVSGQLFETTIAGACPEIDIAILLVHNLPSDVKNSLKSFEFSDSDNVYVQQLVAAAGFPLAQNTVTVVDGVLSGRQDGLLQTTVPINAGNSGGPLIDKESRKIIGVVVSGTQNADGMNYAVPSKEILIRLEEMLHGYVRVPRFNFESYLSTPALLKSLGCPSDLRGSFVSYVYVHSPFYDADLRSGDVLVSLTVKDEKNQKIKYAVGFDNNVQVPWWSSPVTIENIEQRQKLDDEIECEYWSTEKKKLIKTKVFLCQPNLKEIRYRYKQFEKVDYEDFGGVVVMELTENHLYDDNDDDDDGNIIWSQEFQFMTAQQPEFLYKKTLIVVDVLPESSLRSVFEKTIGTADVIVSVNDIKVNSLKEYKNALHETKNGFIVWQTLDGVKTALDYQIAKKEFSK